MLLVQRRGRAKLRLFVAFGIFIVRLVQDVTAVLVLLLGLVRAVPPAAHSR